MGQKRLYNYKQPVNSDDFAMGWMGIFKSGRYAGFDAINQLGGLDIEVIHNITGAVITDSALAQSNPTGALITPQGQMVQEDAPVPLTIVTNGANATVRNDLVIFEHEYVATPGGTDGIYSIIQGPNGSTALPSLTNPEKQTILGVISMPASAGTAASATYTPAQVPLLGGQDIIANFPILNETYARLAYFNSYTKRQGFPAAVGSLAVDLFGTLVSGKFTPVGTSNFLTRPAGSPSDTINEIAATENNSELIVYNASANPLTLTIGGTPGAGGLSIICSYRTGSLVLPQQGWVHIRQVAGLFYLILNDSVTQNEWGTVKTQWDSYISAWTAASLTYDNALGAVNTWKYDTLSPTVVTPLYTLIRYKIIGKLCHFSVKLGVTYDVTFTEVDHTIKLPFIPKWGHRGQLSVISQGTGAESQNFYTMDSSGILVISTVQSAAGIGVLDSVLLELDLTIELA